ncbi:MAG: hypothetical protein L0241_32410 [Planctomycetia bacterium]|nr:hypothetical protein [Planctomycetia bacterium]
MRTAALLLVYVVAAGFGTYTTFRPTFDSGFDSIQTERGDGMLNHFLLEHSWLALSDSNYRGTLVSPPVFFPQPWTIAYSENLFGVAPLYWVLRLFLPYDLAYIWWQIVLNAINFVVFALVARWLRFPHLLALGGAFLWAFGTVHADQIKHQQMIGRFWMPLAAYYAISLTTVPSTKALNRLLACIFLQSLSCIYTGWFLVVGLMVFVPAMIYFRAGSFGELRRFVRERRWAVLRIVGLWGIALVGLFVPYLVVNWGIARWYEECYGTLPTLSAWITGPPGSRWLEATAPYRNEVTLECWLFSGFTIYALMLAALIHLPLMRRESRPALWPVAAASMVTVVVWWVLTLAEAPDGESLWRVARLIPGGQAIRCVSRVYVVVYLFGSIGALAWLTMLIDRIQREWVRFAILLPIVAALIFEQTGYKQPSFARKDFYPIVDQTAESLRGAEVGYVVPLYRDTTGKLAYGADGDVFAMWVGLRAGVPVVNGYSGRSPDHFPRLEHPYYSFTDDQLRAWLKGKYRGSVRVVDALKPGEVRYVVIE